MFVTIIEFKLTTWPASCWCPSRCGTANVIRDLGAWIRHAREVLGYHHIVLAGWSGGGSLSMFYQAQAEHPTITDTRSRGR